MSGHFCCCLKMTREVLNKGTVVTLSRVPRVPRYISQLKGYFPPFSPAWVTIVPSYFHYHVVNPRLSCCNLCISNTIVKILNIYIIYITHLYHSSFWYLSITCNAIACYIRLQKYFVIWNEYEIIGKLLREKTVIIKHGEFQAK